MDQILFIFDLDLLLPLEGDNIEEEVQENRLNVVKSACLRILLHNRGSLAKDRRRFPNFSYRFFSSTGFHQNPEANTGVFHELSLDTLGDLETALEDRFRLVVKESTKQVSRNERYFSTFIDSKGYNHPSERIKRVLEGASVLYEWDRPAMHSPQKTGAKDRKGLGNAIFLMTRFPRNQVELDYFVKDGVKKINHREIANKLFSKKVREFFPGDMNVSLNFVNTASFHEPANTTQPQIQTEIFKAVKECGGSLIPLDILAVSDVNIDQKREIILKASGDNLCTFPASAALQAFLESSRRVLDEEAREIIVRVAETDVRFECENNKLIKDVLVCKGYVTKTSLHLKIKPMEKLVVWSSLDAAASALLRHAHSTSRVAVLSSPDDKIVLLTANDNLSGVLELLHPADSNFLARLLRLQPSEVGPSPGELSARCSEAAMASCDLQPPECTDALASRRGAWDINALETWRVADQVTWDWSQAINTRDAKARISKQKRFGRLQRVRELYAAEDPVLSNEMQKRRHSGNEFERRSSGSGENVAGFRSSWKKHCSEASIASSTASRSSRSSGAGMSSRSSSLLRHNSSGGQDKMDIPSPDKVSSDKKSSKAAQLQERLSDLADLTSNDSVKDVLLHTKQNIVEMDSDNNLDLASFAGASVSLILKHLDETGVPKTSLEEFVSEYLLLSVQQVASLYNKNVIHEIAEHKVQILLRCEVYWLLARKDVADNFIEAILAHLRKISFRLSLKGMIQFLQDVLLPCYVDSQLDLVCTLFDELEQDRPRELDQLLSPGPRSVRTHSNPGRTSGVSQGPNSESQDQVGAKRVPKKVLLARPKSFDASLNRRISITQGGTKRCNTAVAGSSSGAGNRKLGVLAKKSSGRDKGKGVAGGGARRAGSSAKKRVIASSLHKSPRKSLQQARRNLTFDQSPRKRPTTTPIKRPRPTPQKLTPGKRHRVIVPDTPTSKNNLRRKSDGNTSISETPDKKSVPSFLSTTFEQRSQFYTNNRSRNAAKFEDLQDYSYLTNSLEDTRAKEDDSGKMNIFSRIIPRKRKREDYPDENSVDQDSLDRQQNSAPRKRQKRVSISESVTTFVAQAGRGESPLLSAVLPQAATSATPRKRASTSADDDSEDVSPSKRVSFNPKHIPATPKRSGYHAKGILKTPLKSVSSPADHRSASSPNVTPRRLTGLPAGSRTPNKSPFRRDIKNEAPRYFGPSSASRSPRIGTATQEAVDTDQAPAQPEVFLDEEPSSPILSSSKKNRNRSLSDPDLYGFPTPSPSRTRSGFVSAKLDEICSDQDSEDGEVEVEVDGGKTSLGAALTPTKMSLAPSECVEFVSPTKSGRRSLRFAGNEGGQVEAKQNVHLNKAVKGAIKKRLKKESDVLDDELTNYFSPKSNKRQTRTRRDIEDNLAIINAMLGDSEKRGGRTTEKLEDNLTDSRTKDQLENNFAGRRTTEELEDNFTDERMAEQLEDNAGVHEMNAMGDNQAKGTGQRSDNADRVGMEDRGDENTVVGVVAELNTRRKFGRIASTYNIPTPIDLDEAADADTRKKSTTAQKSKNLSRTTSPSQLIEPTATKSRRGEGQTPSNKPKALTSSQQRAVSNSPVVLGLEGRYECNRCYAGFPLRRLYRDHRRKCSLAAANSRSAQSAAAGNAPKLAKPAMDTPAEVIAEAVGTVTDVGDSLLDTPSRRSGRTRVPVSYEESLADFDLSTETSPDYVSPVNASSLTPVRKKKFRLASPLQVSGSRSLSRRRLAAADEDNSGSIKRTEVTHQVIDLEDDSGRSPGKVQQRRLSVKTVNDSVEIEDIEGLEDSQGTSATDIPPRTPEMYGKYFSVGSIRETPTGDFRIKLNRVVKQSSSKRKEAKDKPASTPPVPYFMARVSRSISKDIGISPQKLTKMITESPKARKSDEEESGPGTPDKENRQKVSSINVKKTPRIRLKRIIATGPLNTNNTNQWTAETVVSPVKQVTCRQADGRAGHLDVSDEEDALLGGPVSPAPAATIKTTFSPLTSSSIHKLTTSPLVASQAGRSAGSKLSKKKRINKQLYS